MNTEMLIILENLITPVGIVERLGCNEEFSKELQRLASERDLVLTIHNTRDRTFGLLRSTNHDLEGVIITPESITDCTYDNVVKGCILDVIKTGKKGIFSFKLEEISKLSLPLEILKEDILGSCHIIYKAYEITLNKSNDI